MPLRSIVLSLVLSILAIPLAAPVAAQTLRVVAEEYPGWAQTDGQGYYFELMAKVYEGSGANLHFVIVPLTRAMKMIRRGDAEITPVVYRGDLPDEFLSLRVTTSTDLVSALYLPETIPEWRGPDSFAGLRVAAVQGYAFDRFLPPGTLYSEEQDFDGLIRMLGRQRVDVVLDFKERIKPFASSPHYVNQAGVLPIPCFAAFSSTAQGRQAKALFEQRLPVLLSSNKLRDLYRKYSVLPAERPTILEAGTPLSDHRIVQTGNGF